MIRAEHAIARLRRDLTLGSVVKGFLVASAAACVVLEAFPLRGFLSGSLVLALVGGVWLVLSYRSMKGSRLTAASPSLIAAGDYDQAERQIEEALGSFSLFRAVKLRTLHHLALLRHAQRRFADSALLAQALLAERLGPQRSLTRSTRLILADSLLEVGDLWGAYQALGGLYRERLSLGEALELTLVQLDYQSRIDAWPEMLQGLSRKIELAELMSAEKSARAHALLALAARRAGRPEWETHLRRRAELLADPGDLVARRPVLSELWGTLA